MQPTSSEDGSSGIAKSVNSDPIYIDTIFSEATY